MPAWVSIKNIAHTPCCATKQTRARISSQLSAVILQFYTAITSSTHTHTYTGTRTRTRTHTHWYRVKIDTSTCCTPPVTPSPPRPWITPFYVSWDACVRVEFQIATPVITVRQCLHVMWWRGRCHGAKLEGIPPIPLVAKVPSHYPRSRLEGGGRVGDAKQRR